MRLTAIVLVGKNDEVKANRAVSSVSFADEVIVVKEKLPVMDFSKVRNSALDRAKGEWVLFVDSDEIVTAELREEILYRFRVKPGMTGYKLKRRDRFLGKLLKYGETANVRLLRLAKKDAGRWVRPVHEVWRIKGEAGELRNPFLHYSHESVQEMVGKLDRYSEMEAEYRKRGLLNCYIVKLLETKAVMGLISYPLIKFVHNYIFRLGFLDGMEGFIHAGMMSGHSFLVRAKILSRMNANKQMIK